MGFNNYTKGKYIVAHYGKVVTNLEGGMDASQYKDYILTLLFVKYVTDKSKVVNKL